MKHAHVQPSTRSSLSPTLLRALSGSAVSIALLLFAVAAAAQPIDLDKAASYFAEAKALSDRDAGELWGIELYGPMLFVDPATRFVVANTQDKGGVLTATSDERTLFTGTLPPEVNVANTTVDWSGTRWAMIMWPLSGDPPQRGILLMHESFHRVQRDLGFPLSVRDNAHLDDATGRIWLRLEWRAVALALLEDEPLASDALRDALRFRAYRHQRAEGGQEQEAAVELNEGLAEYTGVRLGGYNHDEQVKRTVNLLRAYDRAANLTRSFAYPTGPAYGLLLDAADPEWRSGLTESADMAALLRRAIDFTPAGLDEESMIALATPYDGEGIITEETKRQAARDTRITTLTMLFIDDPVVRVPMTGRTNFSFGASGAETLPGYGTVYAAMRITGPFGVLESTGPVLWVTETEQSRNQHFRVPAPENPRDIPHDARTIETDGWTLTLNPGWRFRRTNAKGDCVIEES